jgi:hypothetical protein
MYLEPRISVVKAIAGLLLAFVCIFLAVVLWHRSKLSRYPTKEASVLATTFAFWLVLNISADRLSNFRIAFPAGLMTYVAPLLILHAFLIFALHFPPRTSIRFERITLFITTTVSAALCGIILNPAPLLLRLDANHHLVSVTTKWPYILYIGWGAIILILLIAVLRKKWLRSSLIDKKVLKVIFGSFLAAAFFALTFSIIETYNVSPHYFFYYAYILSEMFVIGFAYAILKHGALDSSVTFSRQSLITFWVTLAAIIVLTLLA